MKKQLLTVLYTTIALGLLVLFFGVPPFPGTANADVQQATFDSSNMVSNVITIGQQASTYMFRLGNIYPVGKGTSNDNRHFGSIQNTGNAPAYCVMNVSSTFSAGDQLLSTTLATGSFTITATSTATGTVAVVVNGYTLTTASLANGSTTTQAAAAVATAINNNTSFTGATANSATNVVNVTTTLASLYLSAATPQNGFAFAASTTQGTASNSSSSGGSVGVSSYNYGFILQPSSTIGSTWNAQPMGGNLYTGQVWCAAGSATTTVSVEEAN